MKSTIQYKVLWREGNTPNQWEAFGFCKTAKEARDRRDAHARASITLEWCAVKVVTTELQGN